MAQALCYENATDVPMTMFPSDLQGETQSWAPGTCKHPMSLTTSFQPLQERSKHLQQKSESIRTPLPTVSRQPHHCENVCRHHASRAGHETQSRSGRMGPVIGNLAGGQLSSGQGFESHPSHVLKAVNVLLQSHLVSQELTALTWWAYTFSSILDTHKFSCF